MKPRILYYSDCPFFAGCEQMLTVLLENPKIRESYDVDFVYRYSPEYKRGLSARMSNSKIFQSVRLHNSERILATLFPDSPKIIRNILWALFLTPLRFACILLNALRLRVVFSKRRYEILHLNNGGYPGAESSYSALIAARFCGIRKIVYVVNNQAQGLEFPFRLFDLPFDAFVRSVVSRFITASGVARLRLIRILRITRDQVTRINNGIKLRSVESGPDAVRESLGLPRMGFLVLVVANLERRKGIRHAIDAMSILAKSGRADNIVLLIEGEGPEKIALAKAAKSVDADIRFLARQANIMDLMGAADMLLFPSVEKEDFPNVTLEGMALAKPVVASSIAGVPEQIEHLRSGILVSPGQATEIAHWIARLRDEPLLAKELGKQAQLRFFERFIPERAAVEYLNLYNTLLEANA